MLARNSLEWELMVKIMHSSSPKVCLIGSNSLGKFMNQRPPGLIGDPLREPQGKNGPLLRRGEISIASPAAGLLKVALYGACPCHVFALAQRKAARQGDRWRWVDFLSWLIQDYPNGRD
jgi:hypothetical protein